MHDLALALNERRYITVFDLATRKQYFYFMIYDPDSEADQLMIWEQDSKAQKQKNGQNRKTVGYIKFKTKSMEIPSNWDIIFTNDGEQDLTLTTNGSSLTFTSGTAATVNVTLNKIIE